MKLKFTPETVDIYAKKESKSLIVYLLVLISLLNTAMIIALPFTEHSIKVDAFNIFLLVCAWVFSQLVILAGAYILNKYFIYMKKDFGAAIEIEIGDDYVIRHINVHSLNLINQFGYRRNQRRLIKEVSNKKISLDDIYQTKITKKGIKFYTAGPNGISVPAVMPNYQSAVDFVKSNGEKFKLVV